MEENNSCQKDVFKELSYKESENSTFSPKIGNSMNFFKILNHKDIGNMINELIPFLLKSIEKKWGNGYKFFKNLSNYQINVL